MDRRGARQEVHEKDTEAPSISSLYIEHRLRKAEMEEQFKKKAKEGLRFAADAARIADESASCENRKHPSGGVFVAVDSNQGTVIGTEEGVNLRQRKKNCPSVG